jgi:hypothetical protein
MNYYHTPRPAIEYHPHIKELIEGQEKRAFDKTYHKDRIKALEEREDLIKDSKFVILTDWWCDKCQKDFKGVGVRYIEQDWSNPSQRVAFYKSKCFKNHWVCRWITDRFLDPYWFRSRWVANDRAKHFSDTLQSFQSGYNLLYGKK